MLDEAYKYLISVRDAVSKAKQEYEKKAQGKEYYDLNKDPSFQQLLQQLNEAEERYKKAKARVDYIEALENAIPTRSKNDIFNPETSVANSANYDPNKDPFLEELKQGNEEFKKAKQDYKRKVQDAVNEAFDSEKNINIDLGVNKLSNNKNFRKNAALIGAGGLGLLAAGYGIHKYIQNKQNTQQDKSMKKRNFHYMAEIVEFSFKPGAAIRQGLENTGRFVKGAAKKAYELERSIARAADDLVQRSMKPDIVPNASPVRQAVSSKAITIVPNASPVRQAVSSKAITPEIIADPEILDALGLDELRATLRNKNRISDSIKSVVENRLRDSYIPPYSSYKPPYSNIPNQTIPINQSVRGIRLDDIDDNLMGASPRTKNKNNRIRNLAIGGGVLATAAGLGLGGKYLADRDKIDDD